MRRIAAVWSMIVAAWKSKRKLSVPAPLRFSAMAEHVDECRRRLHRLNDRVQSRPRVAGLSAACLLIFSMFLLLPNPRHEEDEQQQSMVTESESAGFERIEFAEPIDQRLSPVGRDFVSDRVHPGPHPGEISSVAAEDSTPAQTDTWPGLPGSIQTVGFETETNPEAQGAYLIGIIEEIPDMPATP